MVNSINLIIDSFLLPFYNDQKNIIIFYARLPGVDNASSHSEIIRDSGIVSDPSILETPEVMLLEPER